MAAEEVPESSRYGEGDHEVRDRKELIESAVEPEGGFVMLAGWAVAVTAGEEQIDWTAAVFTVVDEDSGALSSAVGDCADDLAMLSRDGLGEAIEVALSVETEDVSYGGHSRILS